MYKIANANENHDGKSGLNPSFRRVFLQASKECKVKGEDDERFHQEMHGGK